MIDEGRILLLLKIPAGLRFAPDGEADSVFWLRFYNKTTRAAVQV
jgi:hypothetical protein